ncbi:hypothetical protein J2S43_007953 [Catenuloplanes nepalensis]|uniref:Uncharacterized protein n=1 Tax=Catenuloplanes nepalensis TaxID=587533 RepID=A0ABT9N7Q6_9ACTN|nr:hypothetical protein [Catenuloplanes nepalensis]MDP9799441.1 hypothetical protein [Catenuloplanes nepalensis]
MPDHDDVTMALLRSLDPAAAEEPPAPGSARYDEILRRAKGGAPAAPVHKRALRRRPLAWMTAATTAVAASVVTVLALGGTGAVPSPFAPVASATTAHQAVLLAADATADVPSLRTSGVMVHEDGVRSTSATEVSGGDFKLVWWIGTVTVTSYVIDGKWWERASDDPGLRTGETDGGPYLAPFGESTRAVVRTALDGTQVQDLGGEVVRDAQTTHYRVELNTASRAALSKLPDLQRAWFNLENPGEVTSIDVWVAGDLIHRISVVGLTSSTIDFYDFGAPITIAVPPGF